MTGPLCRRVTATATNTQMKTGGPGNHCKHQERQDRMREMEIPKKSGGFRTVVVQDPVSKHKYRLVGHELDKLIDGRQNSHITGFRPGQSPVTNALQHVGYKFTLSMDIKDFFDSVGLKELLNAGCPRALAKQALYRPRKKKTTPLPLGHHGHGFARQGLSSSPAAANLAGTVFDDKILKTIQGCGVRITYTRYADDLNISCDDVEILKKLRYEIAEHVLSSGFSINPKKTRIQSSSFGNRIICGVSVGATGISVPRRFKRKLRAALHSHPNSNKTAGMMEWAKLRPPTGESIGKCKTTWLINKSKEAI